MTRSWVTRALLALALLIAIFAAGGAWWFYDAFLRDLPDLVRLSVPPIADLIAFLTQILLHSDE